MNAIVRTDKMSGTDVAKDLASAMYFKGGSSKAAIANGCVVALEGLVEGEREIRKAVDVTTSTKLGDIYLVASPEVIKDKKNYGLGDFINEAGAAIRCYRLTKGDQFSVTKEAIDGGTPTVGQYVEAQNGNLMKMNASAPSENTGIGQVIAIEGDFYVIEVM